MSDRRYFFAAGRLLNWWRGRNANRSEKNGRETNSVGALIHLVVYAFAFDICLTNQSIAQQILWALPLTILVWIFWLNFIYLNSLLLRLIRACGLMRDLPQSRAQGILIGIVATVFAVNLIRGHGWTKLVGIIWIVAVITNQLAATILAISREEVR
ncbi:MAG: hypothetical protein ACJ8KX_13470 [Chthoniobacterales bacterium]